MKRSETSASSARGWLLCSILVGSCAAGFILRAPREPAKFSVEGAVQLDGQPLSHAVIVFLPCSPTVGKQTGAEIKNGKYSIQSSVGVLLGHYRVQIIPYISPFEFGGATPAHSKATAAKPSAPRIPERYNAKSILEVQTAAKPNRFDFSLSTTMPDARLGSL